MWLEHLLFGAVIDASFAVDCKARALYSDSLLIYNSVRSCEAEEFIDKFERDNEVK